MQGFGVVDARSQRDVTDLQHHSEINASIRLISPFAPLPQHLRSKRLKLCLSGLRKIVIHCQKEEMVLAAQIDMTTISRPL